MITINDNIVVAEAIESKNFLINKLTDIPEEKEVVAEIIALNDSLEIIPTQFKTLVLWSGVDYDNIGDWTQEQAENKIIELITQ